MSPARGLRRHRGVLAHAAAVLVLAVLTGVQVLPEPGHLGDRFATNVGDPVLLMWQMDTQAHHLTALMSGNIFYPHTQVLAFSDSLIAYLPVFAPAQWLTGGNPIAAYNVVAFLGYLGGALAVYALAVRLVGSRAAAFAAALLFTLAPYRSAAVGHVQLVGFLFVPLALLALVRLLEGRRWRDAVLLGLSAGLCWLAAVYSFMMLVVAVGAFAVVWAVLHRDQVDRILLVRAAAAAGIAAVLALPTLPAYLSAQRSGAITRDVTTLTTLRADSLRHLPASPLYRALGHGGALSDSSALFPGLLLLGLATVGVVGLSMAWRGGLRRTQGRGTAPLHAQAGASSDTSDTQAMARYGLPLLAAAALCVAVMIGPNRTVLVSGPDRVMRAVLPGMGDLRDLTRFWLVPLLVLALLAAQGVVVIASRLGPRARMALPVVVLAVACLELPVRPDFTGLDTSGPLADVDRSLAAMPPGVTMELPLPPVDTIAYAVVVAPRQLRSLVDGNVRVEGYSGGVPADVRDAIDEARRLPDPAALDDLRARGVRYLVLHGGPVACIGQMDAGEMRAMEASLAARTGAVEGILASGADAVVVLRPAAPGTAVVPVTAPIAPRAFGFCSSP